MGTEVSIGNESFYTVVYTWNEKYLSAPNMGVLVGNLNFNEKMRKIIRTPDEMKKFSESKLFSIEKVYVNHPHLGLMEDISSVYTLYVGD